MVRTVIIVAIVGIVAYFGFTTVSNKIETYFETHLAQGSCNDPLSPGQCSGDIQTVAKISCSHYVLFKLCDVDFSETIQSSDKYMSVFSLLKKAGPFDVITLHLEGYGGDALTATKMYNAIQASSATVIASVEGPVYSAHAVISMAPKTIHIWPGVLFMFHDVQMSNQNTLGAEATRNAFHEVLVKELQGVATQDELNTILTTSGEGEVYILGPDMEQRLASRHSSESKS